jgi:hypothetical protein
VLGIGSEERLKVQGVGAGIRYWVLGMNKNGSRLKVKGLRQRAKMFFL